MKGKYHLILRDNKLVFDLWLERNITIIKGNSGTGKSTLFGFFERVARGRTAGIHCNLKDKLLMLRGLEDWKYILPNTSNKIIIADEYFTDIIQTEEFAKYVSKSDNYFIFISRSGKFRNLPYSTKCVYELSSEKNGGLFITSLHERYLEDTTIVSPDLVITEDKCSGYQLFSQILKCKVVSAEGRDKIVAEVDKHLGSYHSICVIVDGAAFGNVAELVCGKFKGREDVAILAPESFEYLLLNSNPFLRLAKGEITETYDYCDSKEYFSWERYYTALIKRLCMEVYNTGYSKSRLPKVFKNGKYVDVIKHQLSIDESVYKSPEEVFSLKSRQ